MTPITKETVKEVAERLSKIGDIKYALVADHGYWKVYMSTKPKHWYMVCQGTLIRCYEFLTGIEQAILETEDAQNRTKFGKQKGIYVNLPHE